LGVDVVATCAAAGDEARGVCDHERHVGKCADGACRDRADRDDRDAVVDAGAGSSCVYDL
jgi:hypothetical protein